MAAVDDIRRQIADLTSQLNTAINNRDSADASLDAARARIAPYYSFPSNKYELVVWKNAGNHSALPVGTYNLSTNYNFVNATGLPPFNFYNTVPYVHAIAPLRVAMEDINRYIYNYSINDELVQSLSSQLESAKDQLDTLLDIPETPAQRIQRIQLENDKQIALKKQEDSNANTRKIIYIVAAIILLIIIIVILFKLLK